MALLLRHGGCTLWCVTRQSGCRAWRVPQDSVVRSNSVLNLTREIKDYSLDKDASVASEHSLKQMLIWDRFSFFV